MADANPKPTSDSKAMVFVRRFSSTAVLWVTVIWSLFATNRDVADWVLLVLMVAMSVLGLREFYRITDAAKLPSYSRWGIAGGAALTALVFLAASGLTGLPLPQSELELVVLGVIAFGALVLRFLSKSPESGMTAIGTTLLGVVYVPFLLNFIVKIFFFSQAQGAWLVFFLAIVTKFSDAGAYATGSLIGKHKMIPRVSPGKTWEGFGGALVIATGLGLALVYFAGDRLDSLKWAHAVVLGLILSGLAVVGDLVESLFKREAGIKDSGQLFPGIGGMLDLLDSLLFNAPVMYIYLRLFVSVG